MDTKEKLIREFAASARFAPAHKTYDDVIADVKAFAEQLERLPRFVYGLYDMNPDSVNSMPTLVSIHSTLEGADAMVPDNLRSYDRETNGLQVKNYVYVAICKLEVKEP